MFTPEDRTRVRETLISAARADARITGIALTGSAAAGTEDRWSDVDLAFGLDATAEIGQAISEWTDRMYREHGAVDHTDVPRGATIYRVFLLANTLQVDIAFSPAAEFGAVAPGFRLLAGTATEQTPIPAPKPAHLIGMAWLQALHVRSSLARGRVWQAEFMLSGVRDHVLALACLRHGVPAVQGRGMDALPPDVTATIASGLVRSLDPDELTRAFGVVTEAMIVEIQHLDGELADRLAKTLRELAVPCNAQRGC